MVRQRFPESRGGSGVTVVRGGDATITAIRYGGLSGGQGWVYFPGAGGMAVNYAGGFR